MLSSPRVRRAILLVATLGFAAGIVVSIRAQPGMFSDLHLSPVLLVVAIVIPATVFFNAYEFLLSARLIGRRIGLHSALETTIIGSVANMLPLPGGSIVRVAALKAAGAELKHGISTILFLTLIWLGVAFTYAGAWVIVLGKTLVGALFVAGGAGVLVASFATTWRLLKQWQVPMQLLATKLVIVLLDAARNLLCLWALGADANFAQASALAVSGVLGSAVSVVPAGLGVREGVAAAMAPLVGLAASSAFLAMTLSRVLGLATTAPVAAFLAWRVTHAPACQRIESAAPMYLIIHGFSRRNSGDGLLVDLTYEALSQAGIDRERCALLALDPESFSDLENVFRAPGEPTARPSWRLCAAGIEVAADAISSVLGPRFAAGRVARLASRARGLIAVGGGYLVADSFVRQMGVLLNHLVQLRVAGREGVPSIYLPQSIGPLRGPVGRATARALRSVERLYVRDDKSLAEVGGPNVRRCADLAVMKLARELAGATRQEQGDNRTVLVGRDLPNAGSYVERLRELQRLVPSPAWAVQADVMGPRSDRAFYQSLGLPDVGSLANVLKTRPGVVVSVRLHGAISALIAGCPAIHLAYERKGWGAYEDLGIGAFAHDARTFDPATVARQVDELHRDPGEFWGRIRRVMPVLQAQYDDLVSDLRARLVG
jgi:polysaccharide pyruvyl transferase WcaK-like protein/uncharacterized membrane protein YbhN (UPF0104 family)